MHLSTEDVMTSFNRAASHLMAAAHQVRRFGPDGEPAARELERLAAVVCSQIPSENPDSIVRIERQCDPALRETYCDPRR
jgi:hypothetical protein